MRLWSYGAFVFGGSFGILEDCGLEKSFVRFSGFLIGPWTLRVELQGGLEQFQCIVDLYLALGDSYDESDSTTRKPEHLATN